MIRDLVLLVTVSIPGFTVGAQEYSFDHTIDITPVAILEENPAIQDIYVVHADERYTITFYLERDGEVAPYHAHVKTDVEYDKASYKWESNKRVLVKLFNSETRNEFKLKVWGQGGTTGMQILDELE